MDVLPLADIASMWTEYAWPILQFIIGLGVVVFFHELGHFLVAKWMDIQVDRFAIGFGPKVIGFRWGETEYALCALPLGGYVKMLGQEDFKPLNEDDKPDPRAFNSKSVGARMAVIAAGVVMNVIIAAILFVIVGLVGKDFVVPAAGGAAPGMPAADCEISWTPPAEAAATQPATAPAATQPAVRHTRGMQDGDEIVRMEGDSIILRLNGNQVESYSDLAMISALAYPEDKYHVTLERWIDGRTWVGRTDLGVRRSAIGVLGFGIKPPMSLEIREIDERIVSSPLEPNFVLTKIAGREITRHEQIAEIGRTLDGSPIPLVMERGEQRKTVFVTPIPGAADGVSWYADGRPLRGVLIDVDSRPNGADGGEMQAVLTYRLPNGETIEVPQEKLADVQFQVLGMAPAVRVDMVMKSSPAEKAGLKPGDVILRYGDRDTPLFTELMEINEEVADTGAEIVVLRDGQRLTLEVKPRESRDGQVIMGITHVPDAESTVVAGVLPGSVAEGAKITKGSRITAINGEPVSTWADILKRLGERRGQSVEIAYEDLTGPATATIDSLSEEVFSRQDYTFHPISPNVLSMSFEPLTRRVRQEGPWAAIVWGAKETTKLIMQSYATLRSLILGTTSTEAIAGPVGLGGAAVQLARRSFMDFVWFMGFISAALAVMNFLPIPVVDGGHAVFLIIEKIRGKPLPVKVMNIAQMIGLAALLLVFVLVTWRDIVRLISF